jgi:hypothetical protein
MHRQAVIHVETWVNGEERQYRKVHAMFLDDVNQWRLNAFDYATRTQKKTWTVREKWHLTNNIHNQGVLVPPEVMAAGTQAILDQIKDDLKVLEAQRASIEGSL